MKFSSMFAGAVVALGMAVSAAPSQAAPIAPNMSFAEQGLAQQVHYRPYFHRHHGFQFGYGDFRPRRWNHCRAWRHECADRWGWGTWRFQRCLRRHGC